MCNLETLVLAAIDKIEANNLDKEIVLNGLSHEILRLVVSDVKLYSDQIYFALSKFDNFLISERLLFQYFDCIFRMSANWEVSKCIEEIENALLEFISFSENPSYLMYKGALNMLNGDRRLAFEFYEKSAICAKDFFGLPRMYLGANSIKTNSSWVNSEARLPAIFPKIQKINTNFSAENSHVIFLAADSRYFKNFNNYILNNLKNMNSKIPLHFHVVDWDKTCENFNFDVDCDFDISISSEDYKYFRDKTYFATVRFYRALEIMEIYNSNIYIGDVDNKFVADTTDFFNSMAGFDVGLRFNNNGNWFPWWGPSAGSFYVGNTKYGRIFLKHLNEYISARFKVNQNKFTWWFDQLALNEVYFYCKEKYPEMKFVNLSDVKYVMSVVRPDSELGDSKYV